jgi:rhodanese-related sulfurtransferase
LILAILTVSAAGLAGRQWIRPTPLDLRETPAVPPEVSINVIGMDEVTGLIRDSKAVILDARPRIFHEMGHLPGALSLSREEFDRDFTVIESVLRSSNLTLLVYCADADCEDGATVAHALRKRGLNQVILYPGGYAEWEAAEQPVEVSR